ncbi:hypothetical protein O9929_10575 [Vibrio lentus]|nr:hypothetical protein [Vibrio lentus]
MKIVEPSRLCPDEDNYSGYVEAHYRAKRLTTSQSNAEMRNAFKAIIDTTLMIVKNVESDHLGQALSWKQPSPY